MDVNSNGYTVVFAVGMGLLVAVVLALLSTGLQPAQNVNKAFAQKKNLLNAVGYDTKNLDADKVEMIYEQNFDGYIVNTKGEQRGDKASAFEVDMAKEVKKAKEERALPVFVYTDDAGKSQYVLQARGSGLWDAIWVYCSMESDKKTIAGTVFGHKGETPGLGAKISDDPKFYEDFSGKKVFDSEDSYVGIAVLKGEGVPTNENQVDGISGATMTCNGVSTMMQDALGSYEAFLKN